MATESLGRQGTPDQEGLASPIMGSLGMSWERAIGLVRRIEDLAERVENPAERFKLDLFAIAVLQAGAPGGTRRSIQATTESLASPARPR